MSADRQLELLEAISARLGITPTVSVSGIAIGTLYMRYKATRPAGRPWRLERNLLRPFVVAHWRKDVSVVTEDFWEAHRKARGTQKTRHGRRPKEVTLNLEMAKLKQVLRWATRKKLIPSNALAYVQKVKTKSRRESYFTGPQLAQLIAGNKYLRWHHQQENFRVWAKVMIGCATRISEALAIRWDRISVQGTTVIHGKGGKSRVVAFPLDVVEAMTSLDRHHTSPYLFVNWKTGKPLGATTLRTWFRQVIEATGLEAVKAKGDFRLVPHILRHSAASLAEERGASISMIQRLLGHASSETTKVYLHKDDTDAALKMAQLMAIRKPPQRATEKSQPTSEKTFAGNPRAGVRYLS